MARRMRLGRNRHQMPNFSRASRLRSAMIWYSCGKLSNSHLLANGEGQLIGHYCAGITLLALISL